MSSGSWHVEANSARLELERASLVITPLDPAAGLTRLHLDKRPFAGVHPLQVDLQRVETQRAAEIDFYVRGNDLIANYAERPAPAMRTQIYWRSAPLSADGALAAVEVLVSVQTDLLDSCPQVVMQSQIAACETLRLVDAERGAFAPAGERLAVSASDGQPQCYLFRLDACKYSYAEMVHPASAARSELQLARKGGGTLGRLRHQLFAEWLEKGVILRSRVMGLVVDRQGDEAAVARQFAALAIAEPPLTA
jgi:hypothetical protein